MSYSESQTERLAFELASVLRPGTLILLSGDLGTGKTVVARGVIRGLGVVDDYITSPTFTLLNTYPEGRIAVYHFDLYRVSTPDALMLTGSDECFYGEGVHGPGVVLVEWPSQGGDWIPSDHLLIQIVGDLSNPNVRTLTLSANGPFSNEIFHAYKLCHAA